MLTLFTTPIVYLYMDRLSGWLSRRMRAQSSATAATSKPQARSRMIEPVPSFGLAVSTKAIDAKYEDISDESMARSAGKMHSLVDLKT